MKKMKLLFTKSKYINNHLALLVARISVAVLMLSHGLPKLQMLFSGDQIMFPSVLGLSPGLCLALAVFAEVFCSILILVGFATRLATLPLITTMLVAIFSIHATEAFAKKELAVLYFAAYIVLLVSGAGRYSVDHLLKTRSLDLKDPVSNKRAFGLR